jgi:hypothetical protein
MNIVATMGTWKKRVIEKKNKGRQETGKSKGIVASPLVKYMCRSNRSWKHPLYEEVMDSIGKNRKKK